jgi:hypothetical protein
LELDLLIILRNYLQLHPWKNVATVLDGIPRSVTEEMNVRLTKPFTGREVEKALH